MLAGPSGDRHGTAPRLPRRVQAAARAGFLAGDIALHALARRHDVSRNLICVRVEEYERGDLDGEHEAAADLLEHHEARIASPERLAGRLALENGMLKGASRPGRPLEGAPRVAGPLDFHALQRGRSEQVLEAAGRRRGEAAAQQRASLRRPHQRGILAGHLRLDPLQAAAAEAPAVLREGGPGPGSGLRGHGRTMDVSVNVSGNPPGPKPAHDHPRSEAPAYLFRASRSLIGPAEFPDRRCRERRLEGPERSGFPVGRCRPQRPGAGVLPVFSRGTRKAAPRPRRRRVRPRPRPQPTAPLCSARP